MTTKKGESTQTGNAPEPQAGDTITTNAPTPPPSEGVEKVPERKAPSDPFHVFDPVRLRIVGMHNEAWFQREASFMLQIINGSEYLQRSTLPSRVQALMQLANTGLTLNPVMRFCYLLPRSVKVPGTDRYEVRCMLEPSYMGLIKAATDTGSVKLIRAEIVYQGDEIEIEKGTTVRVHHVPYWKRGNKRGEVIAAYSVAVLHDGTVDVLDMGRDMLDQVKQASESVKKNRASPYDGWEEEMFRKAPIRRHLKTLPKSDRLEALMHAVAVDEAQYGSTNAGAFGEASALADVRSSQLRLSGALDMYQGEDREVLRGEIQEAIKANRYTAQYGAEMLAKITGEKNG